MLAHGLFFIKICSTKPFRVVSITFITGDNSDKDLKIQIYFKCAFAMLPHLLRSSQLLVQVQAGVTGTGRNLNFLALNVVEHE
jgi:hypothetical protein